MNNTLFYNLTSKSTADLMMFTRTMYMHKNIYINYGKTYNHLRIEINMVLHFKSRILQYTIGLPVFKTYYNYAMENRKLDHC